MTSVYEDKKGFAFITKRGTHFVSYWSCISNEWIFINIESKVAEIHCDKDEWEETKDFIENIL